MPTERTARSDRPCQIHEIRLNPVPFESDPSIKTKTPETAQKHAESDTEMIEFDGMDPKECFTRPARN
jgi:hypothetical protein